MIFQQGSLPNSDSKGIFMTIQQGRWIYGAKQSFLLTCFLHYASMPKETELRTLSQH